MKGVILAAGKGTRLLPVTKVVDKTWLPIYNKPVIFYAIETLVRSGIREVLIVTNSFNRKGMRTLLEDYPFKTRIEIYFKTRNHSLGMPFSIMQAREFAQDDYIMVVPGDNIFTEPFVNEARGFKYGALAFLRQVSDPTRFGVPIYRNKKLVDIKEKPKKTVTNLAVIAPYFFDTQVFDFIKHLRPSARGELEIVDLLKLYLHKNQLNLVEKSSFWKDVGTFESYLEAGNYFKTTTV